MSICPQAMSNARPSSAVDRREARDRVLGCGVWSGVGTRHVGGDRAVVDDASAARPLRLHQPEGLLRAEECARQVHVDNRLPLLDGDVFQRNRGSAHARVVEEHVEAPELRAHPVEQLPHRVFVGHVRRHGNRPRGVRRRLAQRILEPIPAAAGEHDRIAFGEQS